MKSLQTVFPLLLLLLLACQDREPVSSKQDDGKPPSASAGELNPRRSELIRIGRTWNEFPGLLMEEQFADLEKRLSNTLARNQRNESGFSLLSLAYDSFGYNAAYLAPLNGWASASPESHFPFLLRGRFYIKHAWAARGGDWAGNVGPEGWAQFEERLKLAREDLQKAHSMNPKDPNAAAAMITVCMGLSEPRPVMEKWFQAAISADPQMAEAHSNKMLYLAPKWHGSWEEMHRFGKECYEKWMPGSDSRLDKMLLEVHFEMAKDYNRGPGWWREDAAWKDLELVYGRRAEQNPRDWANRNYYAYYALQSNRLDAAREQFQQLGIRWLPGRWDNDFQVFLQARQSALGPAEASWEWARKECDQAVRTNPRDAEALFIRASAHRALSENKAAEKDLRKAIEIEPDSRYHWALADLYAAEGRKDKAREEYEQVLVDIPGDMRAVTWCKDYLFEKRDFEAAAKILEGAARNDPNWIYPNFYLGDARHSLGQYDKAIAAYETARRLSWEQSDKPEFRANIGPLTHRITDCYSRRNDYAGLLASLSAELERHPDSAEVLNASAWFLATCEDAKLRDPHKAVSLAERAVQIDQRQKAGILDTLATAYEAAGMIEQAIATDEEILRIKPDSPRSIERLAAHKKH